MHIDTLSDARAVVLDPTLVDLHPALMQDAWARLKEARGQPVRRWQLLAPAHLIAAEAPGTVQTIGEVGARVAQRVRGLMARRSTGGDAA